MSKYIPLSDAGIALTNLNATPNDCHVVKTIFFTDYPNVRFNFYRDNTWGIFAPSININPFAYPDIEPDFIWGETKIFISNEFGISLIGDEVNIGTGSETKLAVCSDIKWAVRDE
jgi:hypothetical protein